ncbi:MAG TPA: PAS domain S-box protein [Verrucomicrobiae bacterium]|jgi:PAS domain S-box-containing protein|nr:PAS domain S-box protein [Verrucomicrobiae bacterium]
MNTASKTRPLSPWQNVSVAFVVSIAMVLITTLLLGTFGILNYVSERTRLEAELQSDISLDGDQFSAALALPIWNFDRAQIDKVIESMMRDQVISGVMIRLNDANKTVFARARDKNGRPVTLSGPFPAQGLVTDQRDIDFNGTTLGNMKLFGTPRFMNAVLNRTLRSTFLNIFILDVVLTVSLYLLLWHRVLKPLREIEGYAKVVSSGTRSTQEFRSGRYEGELESLRASIEKMIALLDARYDALRKHEAMLLEVLNSVPQYIFWKDLNSVYLGCNKVFAEAAGLPSPQQVIGKTDFDLPWTPEEAETCRRHDREVVTLGSPRQHIIERAHLPSGARVLLDTSKILLRDGEGQPYGILGVYNDITEQKRADLALARQIAFDEIIQRRLARFANSVGSELDDHIQDTLREMAQFIGADMAFVLQFAPDCLTFSSTHVWYAPGIPSRGGRFQKVPMDRNPWAVKTLIAEEVINVSRLDELPPEAANGRAVWEAEGFKSVLQVPLSGRGGRVNGSVGLVTTTREITWVQTDIQRLKIVSNAIANALERSEAEAALRRSEVRYRTLFEAAQDAILISNGECIVDCNPCALEMFGCTRLELIGESPLRFSPARQPDGHESVIKGREKILAALAGEPQHFEWRHCRRDDTPFEAEVSLNRIDLDHQSFMLGIVRNITERKRAEAAIRESEAKFSTAFRASPDPMSIVELETSRIVDTNEVFERAFGWRREQVIGVSTVDLGLWADPEDRNHFLVKLNQCGSVKDFPTIVKTREGRIYDCLVSAEVAEINGRKSMIVVSQDITKRKQAEQRLEKSRLQLRALSARLQSLREEERTHLAREIHDHLGQLLTALKLDLRSIERKLPALGDATLIAGLNGKLASARELTDETIKSIQQIASELRPAILDRLGLEAAIESETQAFQSRTGVQCESQLPGESIATAPELATAVFRIFQEILTNIARHAHATHVQVNLHRENGSLVLKVEDDGVGMQNSDLDNPKSLGLLGMQERAEILGGQMSYGSANGKGTLVTMRIPLNGKAGHQS